MPKPIKSKRGVYYELEKSPYSYVSPYGDLFKFSSAKKLEIYSRDIKREVAMLEKFLNRWKLSELLPEELIRLIKKTVYRSFYKQVEK